MIVKHLLAGFPVKPLQSFKRMRNVLFLQSPSRSSLRSSLALMAQEYQSPQPPTLQARRIPPPPHSLSISLSFSFSCTNMNNKEEEITPVSSRNRCHQCEVWSASVHVNSMGNMCLCFNQTNKSHHTSQRRDERRRLHIATIFPPHSTAPTPALRGVRCSQSYIDHV